MTVARQEPIVKVDALHKEFPARGGKGEAHLAVKGVSFSVEKGTCLGIVGESGSGKSTVARMILGLIPATSGRITVCGRDRSQPPSSLTERRARAREMQMVFQDPFSSLDRRQTGQDCLDEILRNHFSITPGQRREKINQIAGYVGLTQGLLERTPRKLSGGQCQRLSIARALAAEPQVLVLDESVSALDVSVQAHLLNQLADIRDRTGITQIFISHDIAVINQVSDTVVVMRKGEIVEHGPTASVLNNPQHEYTRRLRNSVPGSASDHG